jgi:hypothetical protein
MKKEIFGYGIYISKIFNIDLQFEDFQNEKVDDFLKNIKNYCIKNRIDIYYDQYNIIPTSIFIGFCKYTCEENDSKMFDLNISDNDIKKIENLKKHFEKELENNDNITRWQTYFYNDYDFYEEDF